jgi:hypothetical protein
MPFDEVGYAKIGNHMSFVGTLLPLRRPEAASEGIRHNRHVSDSRRKVTRYIESLAAAGQSDAQRLAVYGLAYLKELHEGRDPRFTGC